MIIVSSREFRDKQAEYMDLVDNGEQVIVQRGKNKAYSISPISEEDIYFTKEMVEKIEKSLNQAKKGKVTKISGKESLINFLDNL
ncbi:type II toxin-antitoxin system Phd/YefM family antitoxin [Pedobacter mucosus]|uniref:type II toxin-antitoxin system Phd/YefM family antitoxin n=1 Tax=Pedobacter mucosus TaxID=2895286 RepID=UPI001EE3CB4C|nr:type II toxin-antitoxin system Phd/YefM family antitoxin [Pedobacter mucosus]UKT65489.1 type II toxin-antitoxin system Phd/YefM family antitoxin [Pedobacter mucosus]